MLTISTHKEFILIVGFQVGSVHEPSALSGISHLLEHTLFIKSVDRLRDLAMYNAETTLDATSYHIRALSFEKFLEASRILVRDVVGQMPNGISRADFDREKRVVLEELNMGILKSHSTSGIVASFFELHEGTPYSNSVIGTKKSISGIDLVTIQKWYSNHYLGCDPFIVLGAPRSQLALCKKHVDKLLKAAFKRDDLISHPLVTQEPDIRPDETILFLKRKLPKCKSGIKATVFTLSIKTCPHSNSRERKFYDLFGFYGKRKLHSVLREKHGLTYTVEAIHDTYRDTGVLTFQFYTMGKAVNIVKMVYECLMETCNLIKASDKEKLQELYHRVHKDSPKNKSEFAQCKALMLEALYARLSGPDLTKEGPKAAIMIRGRGTGSAYKKEKIIQLFNRLLLKISTIVSGYNIQLHV